MVSDKVYDAVLKKAMGFYYKEIVSEYEKKTKDVCYCKKRNRLYVNENFVNAKGFDKGLLTKKKKFCFKNEFENVVFCIKS